MLAFLIAISLLGLTSGQDCATSVETTCATERNDFMTKSYAMHGATNGFVTDIQLTQPDIKEKARDYCSQIISYASCIETAADATCPGTDTKSTLLNTLKMTFQQMMGDPRAFVANSSEECSAMTTKFYPADEPTSSDPNAGMMCLTTCAMKYNSREPGSSFKMAGLCRDHPDVEECMKRCKASGMLIAQCKMHVPDSTPPTTTSNPELEQQSMMCAQQCALNAQPGSTNMLFVALCNSKPEVLQCMKNCSIPNKMMIVTCTMPEHCVAALQRPPEDSAGSSSQPGCSTMDNMIDCQLPLMVTTPDQVDNTKLMFEGMKDSVYRECQDKVTRAVAKLDSMKAGM